MEQMAMQDAGSGDATIGGTLRLRYDEVRRRITEAAAKANRNPDHIVLVVVTKTATPEQIRELVTFGHRDFGESRVQQLVQRAAQVDEYLARVKELRGDAPTVRWHMIGSVQRNKVRKAIEIARLIHSVDSLRLAEEIHLQGARRPSPVDVLVEVNISGEASKHGVTAAAVRHLVQQMDTMVNLRVRGLMGMAPLGTGRDDARRAFMRGQEVFEDIRNSGIGGESFDLLSMGMSGDFEEAIAAGANVVRVGSAIIGAPALGSEPHVEDARGEP